MKRFRIIGMSFRTRLTLIIIVCLFFVMGLSNLVIYKFALDAQLEQLRDKLKVIAQTATLVIDSDLLLQIPLNRQGVNTSAFKVIADQLNKIKETNPPLKSVYILTKTDKEGIWQFVVDPEYWPTKKGEATTYPGDRYNVLRFPEMMKAYDTPSADKRPVVDEWGVTLSGYAPIRDKHGKTVAVLGVDIYAQDVYNTQKEVHRRFILVLSLGIALSLILGLFISQKISKPIKILVEATRHISGGDLDYRVREPKGNDEISELACAFNKMAQSLSESRRKLNDYFYRILQSLVRILEAKDNYTRGHSDRVADYAEKIASKMGFSKEKVQLLKRTARLHDIGKLAIHQNILNKPEKLTEEEWNIIREHPIVGEQILQPVFLEKEMLAMVRSHHERYDGKGYPDKIGGEDINIFAQIISVADAFDAMTSARAYRPALKIDEAIEELKNNRGTQFKSEIVDTFLKVLEEEYLKGE